MAKEIELTQGKVALVDDEDYEWLSEWKWCTDTKHGHWYAARGRRKDEGRPGMVYMHREVIDAPDGVHVDHINGNGLDNRRSNLRLASKAENAANSGPPSDNTSGYKGVTWHEGRWQAQIGSNPREYLGRFDSPEAAAEAYNKLALERYGEFAYQNDTQVPILWARPDTPVRGYVELNGEEV